MRKIIKIIAAVLMMSLLLSACGGKTEEPDDVGNDVPGVPQEETQQTAEIARENYRISIVNNQFVVDGDKPIWINGTNTPWDSWDDFGGNYNAQFWDEHFAALRANGVNASRVWISCRNNFDAIKISENGMITGITDKFWEDLDSYFEIAERHGIYIMATLISFDHFKEYHGDWAWMGRPHPHEAWRKMMQSEEAINSFIEHYTLPFIERYKDNPFLWSIDLMNEPDWVHEDSEIGKMSWNDISHFFARNAAAIKENAPEILVTVGMAFPKYNSDGSGYEGNKVSDAFLQSLYSNPNAYIDFWSPHYYDWVGPWYGVPFTSSPYGARSDGGWGLCDSKPAVLGETTANGSAGFTLIEDYENAFNNGWQGVMAWTSNGVDGNGGFNEQTTATRHMAEKYPELVFPLSVGNAAPGVPSDNAQPVNIDAGQLPLSPTDVEGLTSNELVGLMGAGWNLGNTLDAHWNARPWREIEGAHTIETLWGNPVTTKAMIDFVKESGFNTVRIPTTYYIFTGDAPDYKIDEAWLDRVQEIVDYVIDNEMFCIINIHHDDLIIGGDFENGWLELYNGRENRALSASEKAAKHERFAALWTQIAERFKDYPETLIFEGINEPHSRSVNGRYNAEIWAEQSQFLNELLQTFVDTVRVSNPDRHLMITPYYAAVGMDAGDRDGRIAGFVNAETGRLFVNDARERLIVSLHYYEPWGFVTAPDDSQWFSAHFDMEVGSVSHNMNALVRIIEENFVANNIPVIMGETGAIARIMPDGSSNEAERAKWAAHYVGAMSELGVPVIIWDDGGAFELLDRRAVQWKYPELARALVEAAR
ncbi:MAG: cellulase family glycosylhydrolase [Oscillospiraceae bacterium]|nr:cellulase family glycosylhydrolase [Oscillospiraceae bacterium]